MNQYQLNKCLIQEILDICNNTTDKELVEYINNSLYKINFKYKDIKSFNLPGIINIIFDKINICRINRELKNLLSFAMLSFDNIE